MKKFVSLLAAMTMALSAVPAVTAQGDTDEGLIARASFDSAIEAEVGKVNIVGSGVTVGDGIRGKGAYIPAGAGNYLTVTSADGKNNLLVGKSAVTIAFFEKRDDGRWPLFIAPKTTAPDYEKDENYIGLYDNDDFRLERYVGNRKAETSSTLRADRIADWKHIAIVLTDEKSELYVNGKLAAQAESKSKLADLFGTDSYIQLGRGNWGNGEDFVGGIDELRIYDRALTAADIVELAEFRTPIDDVKAAIEASFGSVINNVTEDVELPTQYKGAKIEWATSDAGIMTDKGEIALRSDVDKKVTLTATITNDIGETDTAAYELTVKAIPLADVQAALEINDTDNILDSVTMAENVGGIKVEWTSSNTAVVTDEATPNGEGYSIPAGYVTRGETDENVTVSYKFTYAGQEYTKSYDLTVKAKSNEDDKKVAYLYAYFRGEVNKEPERLAIHFATSLDGYNWTDLNGNWPVITSTMGTKSLRDPYIIRSRYGDKFYLLATDLNTQDGQGWGPWSLNGSKYLMVWASEDLVHWGKQRMVKFANDDIGCAWAPESVYDVDTGEYLVYASGKDLKLYAETGEQVDTVYVTRTRDFYSFSEPEIFVAPEENGKRQNAIDSTIIRADDNKYYQFYKKYNSEVRMMVSDHAAGPYKEVTDFKPIGGEGPAIYKVNGTNQYALCIDNYSVYMPYLTDNIASGKFTQATEAVSMPTGSKHGGMIPITQKEYDALMEAYGPAPVGEDGSKPIFAEYFEGDTTRGTLNGGASLVQDAEKNSKVLSLDGKNGYYQFPANLFDRKNTFTLLMDIKSSMDGNFFDFALGQGDGKNQYMYFRARKNALDLSETVYGYQHERNAHAGTGLDNQWARIALVVKPGYLAIYRDGKLVAENTDARVGDSDLAGDKFTTSHLGMNDLVAYLGKSFFSADKYVAGSFDNILLYDRALSPDEIAKDVETSVGLGDLLEVDEAALTLPAEVREDLVLPTAGINGSEITWTSSNSEVVATDGKVTRPAFGGEDVAVTLTATLTLAGLEPVTKEFNVLVKAGGPLWHSTSDWATHPFTPVDEYMAFYMTFIPKTISDSTVALGPNELSLDGWGKYNIGFHTTDKGKFEAFDGTPDAGSSNGFVGFRADNEFTVEAGKAYDVVVTASAYDKTYCLYVRAAGGEEFVTIAENYPYRDKTEGAIAWVNVRGGNGVAADLFAVDSFRAFGVTVHPTLRIIDGENSASFGIANDIEIVGDIDALERVGFICGAAQPDADGNYTDIDSDKYYEAAKKIDPIPASKDGRYRVTISGISNNNCARVYFVDPDLHLSNGITLPSVGIGTSLYGALVDSIMSAEGTKIPEARLKAANEIISFVKRNMNDKSVDKFPLLDTILSTLYNEDGTLQDKAKELGIDDTVTTQFAEALSLESVDIEYVSTEAAETESGDITYVPDAEDVL